MPYTGPATGFCVATAIFVCGAAGLPTPPDQLPAASAALTLGTSGSTTLAPGQTLTLSGTGFAGNADVIFGVYSSPRVLGSAVADSSGNVATTVTVPMDLLGSHEIVALGDGPNLEGRSLESPVDIETIASTTAAAALAHTGFDAAAWILGAVGMIITGFALIRTTVFRRRLFPATTGNPSPRLPQNS